MNDKELKLQAKKILESIPADEMRETIAKSRWTCDSHWMMAMVTNAGWEKANKMNLQVGKATGNVEMVRLMRDLNMEKPKNEHEFMTLMAAAMEMFTTKDYFDYEFIRMLPSGKFTGIIRKCYAYTKVSSIGVDKEYECGCFGLRAGWYQAMGLDLQEKLGKCLKNGDDCCEINIEGVIFPN
jgi:hypothetical protein